jgi:hypothetical protein
MSGGNDSSQRFIPPDGALCDEDLFAGAKCYLLPSRAAFT